MINHSCDPNSLCHPSDLVGKTIEVRAIKEIKADEEVTLSYLEPYKAILGEKKEKELELAKWSFQCKCEICLQPEDDRIKQLRDEWNKLELKKKDVMAAKNSEKESELWQRYTNILDQDDQDVDFITTIDKPFLSFSFASVCSYFRLAKMGLQG